VHIGKYCHINTGAIVKAGAEIKAYRKLEAGEVVLGYEAARVRPSDKFDGKNSLS